MSQMSQTKSRFGTSQELLKASNFFAFPEKPADLISLFMRAGLLVCLVSSIILALYSAFFTRSQWFVPPDLNRTSRDVSVGESGPTNISHILFGIGASVKTLPKRRPYMEQWWVPNATRGYLWLDEEPKEEKQKTGSIPYRVSEDWTRFRYLSSQSAVRIARIVLESFKLGLPNVRWFVMGDDDSVFFTDNLVSVLATYDHNQMYYIGGNSESVEQDVLHSYDMAFGGGGIAVSYPLAAKLVNIIDGCLDRYYRFYGSDQRIWACINEIGVPLTQQDGFHQLDIRGDPYGLLAAHPLAPLVSLHHLDQFEPIFPNQTQMDSFKSLMKAYRVDPSRILQQCFCYDRKRKWSISISWGYTLQIYPSMVPVLELQRPFQTFKTWRSWSNGPFTFNTRPMSSNPCQRPVIYFLDRVEETSTKSGSLSIYKRFVAKDGKQCNREDYGRVMTVQKIIVSSIKMDPANWKKAPHRKCCEIMDRGSIKNGDMRIRIRNCRAKETITV
ncbi:hypothetical protein FEM48_Zijuj03G0061700 [Ziziphus jujuba var. spinosa]|uniref:Uncharacterized protein n=1 Tax=Ziziphus jujuba var. spinosa TaxID=714518 RepID=A0A978VNM8_ZIZJJ|nr:hypothetical protein FEM48_Zijuj03G0061700 [Ziziphus jujuba var. spinosa]